MKHLALTFLLTGLSLQSLLAWGGPGPWAGGAYYPGQLNGRYSANVYNNTQDRGDYSEMNTPSGNTVRTDTFTVFTNSSVSTTYTTNFIGDVTTNYTTNYSYSTNLVDSGAAGVVSGVLGFGISNGVPATGNLNSGAASAAGTTLANINLDNNLNYFIVYVDGDVFAGQTAAGINLGTKKVAGSLWNGTGRSTYERSDNPTFDTNGDFVGYTTTFITVPGASAGGYFNAKIKSDKSPFTFKGAGEISTRGTPQSSNENGNVIYPFNLDGIKVSDN